MGNGAVQWECTKKCFKTKIFGKSFGEHIPLVNFKTETRVTDVVVMIVASTVYHML